MMENYLSVLEDSLRQKIQVLDEIFNLSGEQEQLLKQDDLDLDAFDRLVEQKDVLSEKLDRLDDGFESLYARLEKQLKENKDMYRAQIAVLQELIARVTEKTVSIQARETRNKEMLSRQLARLRQGINQSRRSSKAAYDYYMNMSNGGMGMSQFMDQKN